MGCGSSNAAVNGSEQNDSLSEISVGEVPSEFDLSVEGDEELANLVDHHSISTQDFAPSLQSDHINSMIEQTPDVVSVWNGQFLELLEPFDSEDESSPAHDPIWLHDDATNSKSDTYDLSIDLIYTSNIGDELQSMGNPMRTESASYDSKSEQYDNEHDYYGDSYLASAGASGTRAFGAVEFTASMSLRPAEEPTPPLAPTTYHRHAAPIWFDELFNNVDPHARPLLDFFKTDTSVKPLRTKDRLDFETSSMSSAASDFNDDDWTALGFSDRSKKPAQTALGCNGNNMGCEVIQIVGADSCEHPGCRLTLLMTVAEKVPCAVVPRAELRPPARDGSAAVNDRCDIEVLTLGRIANLNAACTRVEQAVQELLPEEAYVVDRVDTGGKLRPIKPGKIQTGYYLGRNQGDCVASELTPLEVAEFLGQPGSNFLDYTENVQDLRTQRAAAH